MNDRKCSEINKKKIQSEFSYILFYRRKKPDLDSLQTNGKMAKFRQNGKKKKSIVQNPKLEKVRRIKSQFLMEIKD